MLPTVKIKEEEVDIAETKITQRDDTIYPEKVEKRPYTKLHSGDRPFKCNQCSKTFKREVHLKCHKLVHKNKREAFECVRVKQEEIEIDDVRIIQGNDIIDPEDIKKEFEETSHQFKYDSNTKTFEQESQRSHDILPSFKCDSCSRSFRLHKQLEYHKLMHKKQKKFKCEQCDESFRDTHQLRRHYKLAHRFSPLFPCNVCKAVCSSIKAIERHKERHVRDPPVVCEMCNKQFLNSTGYLQHKEGAHEGRFRCEICSKNYPSEAFLWKHCKQVHGVGLLLECEVCGYTTKYEKVLALHKSRRCKGPPVEKRICNCCDFVTLDEFSLRGRDSGVWFRCKLCDYKARKDNRLAMHVFKEHGGVLHFKCGECRRGFATRRLLDIHMRRHRVTEFRCEWCSRYYEYKATLRTHLRLCRKKEDGGHEEVCSTPIEPDHPAMDNGSN